MVLSIQKLYFAVYLITQGISPKEHGVKHELVCTELFGQFACWTKLQGKITKKKHSLSLQIGTDEHLKVSSDENFEHSVI